MEKLYNLHAKIKRVRRNAINGRRKGYVARKEFGKNVRKLVKNAE